MAGRNPQKGEDAVAKIRAAVPTADVVFEKLDLGSLSSVEAFGAKLRLRYEALDLLINNAGVMTPPKRQETSDGFELQLGTNHLGHFALTGHLMPLLRKGASPRVVTVSSIAARGAAINFDDLNSRRNYRPMPAYGQSKLACLMFAMELQRRSDAFDWGVASLAAHPELLHNGGGRGGPASLFRSLFPFLFQPSAQGALPTLFAATSPDARSAQYYGPDGVSEIRGFPTLAVIPGPALDKNAARRLWEVSEQLTGVRYG
ncbi:hypothetical protein LTR94_024527 [Friedmanniomyces endolithicus]|nr:hypothetical protein LTR94_024527 [Friedmanniomyces endolithicus]